MGVEITDEAIIADLVRGCELTEALVEFSESNKARYDGIDSDRVISLIEDNPELLKRLDKAQEGLLELI